MGTCEPVNGGMGLHDVEGVDIFRELIVGRGTRNHNFQSTQSCLVCSFVQVSDAVKGFH